MNSTDSYSGTLEGLIKTPHWVAAQQLRLAFEGFTLALAGSVFCAFTIVVLLWPVVDNRGLIVWLGAASMLTLGRLSLLHRYQRTGISEQSVERWYRGFAGSTCLAGVLWGCLSIFLFPADSAMHQTYLAFVLAGLSAGAVNAYSTVPRAFACFALPALVPFALQVMLHNPSHNQGIMMALLIVAFLLGLMRSATGLRRNAENLLELQVRNSELNRALHHRATHDSLVNLANQGEFNRRLQRLTAENRREQGGEYSLVFIDLDYFKEVNDTGGHAAGDLILKGVAEIIRRNTRGGDTAARVGGDEFAAILEGCPHDRAIQIAEKIRHDIENLRVSYEGHEYSVKASIGVSYGQMGKHSATGMLKAADAACYAAKESGRNTVRERPADDGLTTSERFELTQSLSLATLN